MASVLEESIRRPLEALNFFMADMQAGVGPFLGVFLLAAAFGVLSIVSILMIPRARIDDRAARGGWIAEAPGYGPMFLILGSFAFGSIAPWLAFAPLLRPACARPPDRHAPTPAGAPA